MKKKISILITIVSILGCHDIIELEDISKNTVILVAPFNNAVLQTTTLNFSWEPMVDADDYQIQIATPNFGNPLQVVVDSTVNTNNVSFDLEINTYEWRVKAKNSGYETLYSQQAFTIEE